jgi:hypothetical protein
MEESFKNSANEKQDINIAVLEERLKSSERALNLQAREYERRLDMLNNEAERLRNMQITYLPREVYEVNHKLILEKLNKLSDWQITTLGQQSGLSFGWKILIGFLSLISTIAILFNIIK